MRGIQPKATTAAVKWRRSIDGFMRKLKASHDTTGSVSGAGAGKSDATPVPSILAQSSYEKNMSTLPGRMDRNELFCRISSECIANLVKNAKCSVCYASPGIQLEPAKAMVDVANRIGLHQVTVSLDFDERVMRMGYGSMEAVQELKDAGILMNHAPGLRSSLIIVDGEGYIFTPTALYLEGESRSDTARNAMRLSPEQVTEAMARLSPQAKALAIDQARDPGTKEYFKTLPVEIDSSPVRDNHFKHVDENLKKAPPVNFDVARRVRVYEPYLQYVELKLTGAAIQRHRVKIPRSLQELGGSKNLEGRLHTTFDLLRKDSALSSKYLEDELREIREVLAPSLGSGHGRVILKKNRPLLDKCVEDFRKKLESHRNTVVSKLQKHINESRQQVVDYYLPRALETPSLKLCAQSEGGKPTEESARKWLDQELNREFPTVTCLTQEMKLDVHFKDVTLETLERTDFIEQVRRAFPDMDWDRAHKEFMAAGERNSDETGNERRVDRDVV